MLTGFFLISLRDIWPDFFTIIIANTIVIFGYAYYYEGVSRLVGQRQKIGLISITLVGMGVIGLIYFTYGRPSVNARIVLMAALHIVTNVFIIWELLRELHPSWRIPRMATALVFGVDGLMEVFRIIWTLGSGRFASFMSAGLGTEVVIISGIFLLTGSSFGFIWIVSKRLEYKLVRQATYDPLTNVLNRRGIESLVEREIQKIERTKAGLAVVIVDIDHFKRVNDLYGHAIGDIILREFAQLIKMIIRPYDIFGRIGGEEFIIILPDTQTEQAQTIAERIRQQIEEHEFGIGEHKIRVTSSFGISNHIPASPTFDRLIPYADQALYKSKHDGRNRISVYEPSSEQS